MSSPKSRAATRTRRSCSSAAISTAGTRAPARSTMAPGVAIATAAAKRIMDAGRPLRTIRIVWFGAEEPGCSAARPIAQGAWQGAALRDRRRKRFRRRPHLAASTASWQGQRRRRLCALDAALAPLGIVTERQGRCRRHRHRPTIKAGAPWISLNQDGTRYFDVHHTPDDTLDKIDPEQLRQNVAAWTAMLAVLSGGIEPEPKQAKRR